MGELINFSIYNDKSSHNGNYMSLFINIACIHIKIFYFNSAVESRTVWSSHMKVTGMLVSLRGINFGLWVSLRVLWGKWQYF